jgi:hypothetical protein
LKDRRVACSLSSASAIQRNESAAGLNVSFETRNFHGYVKIGAIAFAQAAGEGRAIYGEHRKDVG